MQNKTMSIWKHLRRWIFGDPLNNPEPDEVRVSAKQLKGKTGLALKSLLLIHESIEDAEALEGYEATPKQVNTIYWEVWAVLARNPDLNDPKEILKQWMEDCIDGMHLDRDLVNHKVTNPYENPTE
jgi:hypothetical protein